MTYLSLDHELNLPDKTVIFCGIAYRYARIASDARTRFVRPRKPVKKMANGANLRRQQSATTRSRHAVYSRDADRHLPELSQ
jgi:hypothetical protein